MDLLIINIVSSASDIIFLGNDKEVKNTKTPTNQQQNLQGIGWVHC